MKVIPTNFSGPAGLNTLARHLVARPAGMTPIVVCMSVDARLYVDDGEALWLVPCTPSARVIQDTARTLKELIEMGVAPSRILVLKSKVAHIEEMDEDFASLTAAAATLGVRLIDSL
jgi:hypothetical protein